MAHSHPADGPAVWEAGYLNARSTGWEKALAVAGFLILLQTFRTLLLSGGDDRTGGSALFQLVSGSIYLAAILSLLARGIPPWALTLLRRSWPIVALTLLTPLSVIWSQVPETSLRRAIALLLSTAFALFLVIRFDPRTIMNILLVAFAVFVVVGIFAIFIPGVGLTPSGAYSGAWRGLTGHKNVFGLHLALAVALLPLAAVLGLVAWPKRALALGVVAFGLLLLAKSATSLVAAVAGITIGTALYAALGGRLAGTRLRPEIGITFLILAIIGTTLVVTHGWSAILEALGRDPTLTGRTKLWDWAMRANSEREWLGSGYRAFWIGTNTKYFFEVFAWRQSPDGTRSDSFAGPDHAHSGYVDTYLELGLLGVATFVIAIIWGIAMLWRALRDGNSKVGFIFAVILSFLLVYATTERSILQQSEDLWFLFVLFYLLTAKETMRDGQLHSGMKI
jgi:exopolysaccharide production protein ExoQ